jgi:hypothetical protein
VHDLVAVDPWIKWREWIEAESPFEVVERANVDLGYR